MNTVNTFITGAFGLILVYLVLFRGSETNQILSTLGRESSNVFRTLQGR